MADQGKVTATEAAMRAVLEGEAAVGKGPWAKGEPKKLAPGDTPPLEAGMRAVLKADAVRGRNRDDFSKG